MVRDHAHRTLTLTRNLASPHACSFVVGVHMAITLAELVLNGVWYW